MRYATTAQLLCYAHLSGIRGLLGRLTFGRRLPLLFCTVLWSATWPSVGPQCLGAARPRLQRGGWGSGMPVVGTGGWNLELEEGKRVAATRQLSHQVGGLVGLQPAHVAHGRMHGYY